jgi:hypothetical protein
MITVNDILTQFQTFKSKINTYYTLIYNEANADVTLDDLNNESKTAEFNLWMWISAAVAVIMDGIWNDRQAQITAKINEGIPGTDPWLQLELFKFQYGDTLLWNASTGKYYYAVIDETKQIIKRCAVISSGGITALKVASDDGAGNPIPLTAPQLVAFKTFVNQIQWSGAKIAPPVSFDSDKLDAPMTVYYDGTKKLDDVKAIVETAWSEYLTKLPFNSEYSINKHGDYVENYVKVVGSIYTNANEIIKEVTMGAVQARANTGSFASVIRIYKPVSGYLVRDPAISLSTMITYVPL